MLLSNLFKKKEKSIRNNIDRTLDPEIVDIKKVAARKGELGEYKIDIQLDQLPKDYKVLSDLLLKNPKARSGYSQIDHLVITPYALFVIETKNYQGTIYGGKDRKTWLVNGKFKFMNPFIQNYGHIQALKQYIDKKYYNLFISIVSFTKRCTFRIDEIELRQIASNDLIVYDVELSEFMHRKLSVIKLQNNAPLLSENEITSIFKTFEAENVKDTLVRSQHIRRLEEKKEDYIDSSQKLPQQNTCIVCNKTVTDKVKAYCLTNDKFYGKIYCFEHQKNVK